MIAFFASMLRALRFWSRLSPPVLFFEVDPHAPPSMHEFAPAVAAAGAVIGLVGAVVLIVLRGVGLPVGPAAVAAVAALVLATGGMHEDAVADVADGFGGGSTPEARLAIMKDPLLGSYGACALVLALMLKTTLLASLAAAAGTGAAALALVAAAGTARLAGLLPLVLLPPARTEGLGAAAGPLDWERWLRSALWAGGIAGLALVLATGRAAAFLAPAAAAGAAWAMVPLARRRIGGQTGDVCGAATLLADLAFLAVALAPFGF